MMPAPWFGVEYPQIRDLEALALEYGAPVCYESYKAPFLQWDNNGPLCIVIPTYDGPFARAWGIAHEVGHLVLGHGPLGWDHSKSPEEIAANIWAAHALIPDQRVKAYQTKTVEGFLRAINKHYQEVPKQGGIRNLACLVAYSRMKALEEAG